MSHSTLWKVYKTRAISYVEFVNSHGSAPPVWDWLCKRYLGWETWVLHYADTNMLWDLWKNKDVPRHMRFALLVTFDDGFVEPKNLLEASTLCELIYASTYNPEHVNHWQDIGESYKKLSNTKDKRLLGIALGCTSVSDPWEYDIKDRNPFSIFEALDSI